MAEGLPASIDEPPEPVTITAQLNAAQGWTGVQYDGTIVVIHQRYHPDPTIHVAPLRVDSYTLGGCRSLRAA